MTRSLFRRGASGALASLAFLALAFPTAAQRPEYVFVLHGGAGTITRESLTPDLEREYREKLTEALVAGRDILASGGSGLDAVEGAIRILEDSPLFNAGKGAVFTHDGKNELDASIMDGKSRQAGAVTGVSHVKNPISLARLVMEKSRHVMLSREGAEEFALEQGIELVPRDYFFTERRWESLQRAREAGSGIRRSSAPARTPTTVAPSPRPGQGSTSSATWWRTTSAPAHAIKACRSRKPRARSSWRCSRLREATAG
jgi:beta-aspartyl-peptidase (threonine type)